MMAPRPHVLVTNDDGIDAAGLRVLTSVAVEAGLDVTVAAPHVESSGSSAALTSLEEDGRLRLHDRELDGLPVRRAVGVEALPGFIALTGARGAFGPKPEVVLSGVNHGRNTGHAILHSGTVGAALTASANGCRALAVSLDGPGDGHLETAAHVARCVLRWLLGQRPNTVVNVNVPDVALAELRGLRHVSLASFGAVQAKVLRAGEGFVQLEMADVDADHEPGTDAYLLAEGWSTITALRAPCEALGIDLPALP